MTGAKELVHNPAESLPDTATPVENYVEVNKEGTQLVKKTIVNKLGEKRQVWVRETKTQ